VSGSGISTPNAAWSRYGGSLSRAECDKSICTQPSSTLKQSLETGEPSLEEQLKQYETGTYVVKVAATKPVESEQVLREADDDEPGMDI
jgi:hypothetical protein